MACDPYRLRRRQPQARIERKIEQACDPQYEVADRAEPGRIWPVAGNERDPAAPDLTECSTATTKMRRYPVSTRINHVQNDDADCARLVEPDSSPTQAQLFRLVLVLQIGADA